MKLIETIERYNLDIEWHQKNIMPMIENSIGGDNE